MSDSNRIARRWRAHRCRQAPKSSIGPLLAGIIAIAPAGSLGGPGGLLVAVLGVGSWWGSKFWPRKDATDDAGARAFLAQLETTAGSAADPGSPKREQEAEPGVGVPTISGGEPRAGQQDILQIIH